MPSLDIWQSAIQLEKVYMLSVTDKSKLYGSVTMSHLNRVSNVVVFSGA